MRLRACVIIDYIRVSSDGCPIVLECGACVQYTSYRFWKSPWFVIPMLVGSLQIFMVMTVIATAMMFPSTRQSLLEITITVSLLSWYALRQLHQVIFRRRRAYDNNGGGNAANALDGDVGGGGDDGNDIRSNSSPDRHSSREMQEEMDADEAKIQNDIFTCFGMLGPRRKKKKPKNT